MFSDHPSAYDSVNNARSPVHRRGTMGSVRSPRNVIVENTDEEESNLDQEE